MEIGSEPKKKKADHSIWQTQLVRHEDELRHREDELLLGDEGGLHPTRPLPADRARQPQLPAQLPPLLEHKAGKGGRSWELLSSSLFLFLLSLRQKFIANTRYSLIIFKPAVSAAKSLMVFVIVIFETTLPVIRAASWCAPWPPWRGARRCASRTCPRCRGQTSTPGPAGGGSCRPSSASTACATSAPRRTRTRWRRTTTGGGGSSRSRRSGANWVRGKKKKKRREGDDAFPFN